MIDHTLLGAAAIDCAAVLLMCLGALADQCQDRNEEPRNDIALPLLPAGDRH